MNMLRPFASFDFGRNFILSSLHSIVIDETLLGLHYMQSAISGIVDDISGILKLALMTSEDFDGRLHTYAIGIKLALGPNLQVCNPITKTAPNLHWINLQDLQSQ